jgi:hypothetical protein
VQRQEVRRMWNKLRIYRYSYKRKCPCKNSFKVLMMPKSLCPVRLKRIRKGIEEKLSQMWADEFIAAWTAAVVMF